jgi:membrane protein
VISDADPKMNEPLVSRQRRIWDRVSCLPLRSLWNLHDTPLLVIIQRTWKALFTDNIFGNAAELGFYFFFSLFPTLFSASFILGLAAHSAEHIYDKLLQLPCPSGSYGGAGNGH